jgi:hypothetical protein
VDTFAARTEIETALKTITGLRVGRWGDKVNVPAALVTLPESVKAHGGYGVGFTVIEGLMVLVLAAKPSERTALDVLAPFVREIGASSIKGKLESYAWTTVDDVTVTQCDFEVVSYQDTPYLSAMFHTQIIGKGAV